MKANKKFESGYGTNPGRAGRDRLETLIRVAEFVHEGSA
jgi:hypothetical protein